jgi:hypothetical protein
MLVGFRWHGWGEESVDLVVEAVCFAIVAEEEYR